MMRASYSYVSRIPWIAALRLHLIKRGGRTRPLRMRPPRSSPATLAGCFGFPFRLLCRDDESLWLERIGDSHVLVYGQLAAEGLCWRSDRATGRRSLAGKG